MKNNYINSRNLIMTQKKLSITEAYNIYIYHSTDLITRHSPKLNSIKPTLNHRWIDSIIEVLPRVNILHGFDKDLNMNNYTCLVSNLILHHGEREALIKFKALKLAHQQYVLEQEISRIPFRKVDKDQFPRCLRWLKPNKNNLNEIRYTFSVLRISDLFSGKLDESTDTITNPSKAKIDRIHDIQRFIRRSKSLRMMQVIQEGYLPLSNRAGPNGPATISAIADLTALRRDTKNILLLKTIEEQLKDSIPWLDMNIHASIEGDYKHSKIIFLADKAGKTRVIAIADFWSNAALSNIHRTFMKHLNRIKFDLTYRQDEIPKYIKFLGLHLFSSDMTAFTDRFPIELEKTVVETAMGPEVARRWEIILTKRDFSIGNSDKTIRYEVGNPMGVLSSWPVSATTHHEVLKYCAYKTHQYKQCKYGMIGDDSIVSNKLTYDYYHTVLSDLGVDVSLAKCTRSTNGSGEFAKRLFLRSIEVTGLPVALLRNMDQYPEQVLELVRLTRQRGYPDKILGPGLSKLIETFPNGISRTVSDLLQLPESITQSAPLEISTKEGKRGQYSYAFNALSESHQKKYLELAQNMEFWHEVNRLLKPKLKDLTRFKFEVKPNHPIVHALSSQLDIYLGLEDFDENEVLGGHFSGSGNTIYEAWIRGEYRNLANVPSLDAYKFKNRGHKATRSKYLVFKRMLDLVKTNDTSKFLHPLYIISDEEIFEKAFEELRSNFDIPALNANMISTFKEGVDSGL